jgi:hypothetical protein
VEIGVLREVLDEHDTVVEVSDADDAEQAGMTELHQGLGALSPDRRGAGKDAQQQFVTPRAKEVSEAVTVKTRAGLQRLGPRTAPSTAGLQDLPLDPLRHRHPSP